MGGAVTNRLFTVSITLAAAHPGGFSPSGTGTSHTTLSRRSSLYASRQHVVRSTSAVTGLACPSAVTQACLTGRLARTPCHVKRRRSIPEGISISRAPLCCLPSTGGVQDAICGGPSAKASRTASPTSTTCGTSRRFVLSHYPSRPTMLTGRCAG